MENVNLNTSVASINFTGDVESVAKIDNKKDVNQVEQVAKGTHGTLVDNVMRTSGAVYEGSWMSAQREILAGHTKLD